MDDLWYKCVFEAERIIRKKEYQIDSKVSHIGTTYYRWVHFKTNYFSGTHMKKVIWFDDEKEPDYTYAFLVKIISEYLDFKLRYGG